MADTNREALGRVLMPILTALVNNAGNSMSEADRQEAERALFIAKVYFAMAEEEEAHG